MGSNSRYSAKTPLLASVFILFACLSACLRNSGHADSIPVEDFIFKSERSSFKLSPNGKYIAYLGVHDHCRNVFVIDLDNDQNSRQLTYQNQLNVQNFNWINDSLIIFSNIQHSEDSLDVYTVRLTDESVQRIMAPTNRKLKLIQPVQEFDGFLYGAMNIRDSVAFDLYKIYLDGRTPEMVYQNPGKITSWIASSDGVVRLAMESDSAQESILYRETDAQSFREISNVDFRTAIKPLGFKRQSTTEVYALSNLNRDKLALVEFDISTGKEIQTIASHPDLDLNWEGYSHKLEEAVFYSTTAKGKSYTFFNKEFQTVYDRLAKQFPDMSIDFVDYNKELDNFIVEIQSDTHPGELYHYDRVANKLKLLTTIYPDLKDDELLPMETVQFETRDNRTVDGYITYPKGRRKDCPVVVLVHDGPGRRDEWGFDPEVQFLANRGYAVFQVNYRGTAGYGKDFWSAGFKEWGGKIQLDITDGVMWLIHQGIANKDRLAIMGTGFGGYSALHAACFNPSLYQCVISSSGYSNLFTYFREVPAHLKLYVQMYYEMVGNPESETQKFKAISPVFHADQVTKPILLFQGGKDRFTSVTDVNQFVAKLKQNNIPVRYIFKEDEGRRFKKEENTILYYQEIERFLSDYLK